MSLAKLKSCLRKSKLAPSIQTAIRKDAEGKAAKGGSEMEAAKWAVNKFLAITEADAQAVSKTMATPAEAPAPESPKPAKKRAPKAAASPKAETAIVPATKQFYVRIGDQRFPFTTLNEASAKFAQARDAAGGTARSVSIEDEAGAQVGYISQNGKIWEGTQEDWKNAKLLFDPFAESAENTGKPPQPRTFTPEVETLLPAAAEKPATAPAKAAAKVEDHIEATAKTEGVRDAREVKSELIERLEKAVAEAEEKESSEVKRIRKELAEAIERKSPKGFLDTLKAQLAKEADTRDIITIQIPGDGTFKIRNNADSLRDILSRAKRLPVEFKEPAKTGFVRRRDAENTKAKKSASPAREEAGETPLSSPPVPDYAETAYEAAVEAQDWEAAQRMVDQAAAEAGYSRTMFHGGAPGITEFKPPFYLTPFSQYADAFTNGKKGALKYRVFLKTGNETRIWGDLKPISAKEYQDAIRKQTGKVAASMEKVLNGHTEILPAWKWTRFVQQKAPESFKESGIRVLVVTEKAEGSMIQGESFLVTDPSQIKSADPVTRDESGNVIPLSQRFNPASPSILYSPPQPDLPAMGTYGAWVSADGKVERVNSTNGHADAAEAIVPEVKIKTSDDYEKVYRKKWARVTNAPDAIYVTYGGQVLSRLQKAALEAFGITKGKPVLLDNGSRLVPIFSPLYNPPQPNAAPESSDEDWSDIDALIDQEEAAFKSESEYAKQARGDLDDIGKDAEARADEILSDKQREALKQSGEMAEQNWANPGDSPETRAEWQAAQAARAINGLDHEGQDAVIEQATATLAANRAQVETELLRKARAGEDFTSTLEVALARQLSNTLMREAAIDGDPETIKKLNLLRLHYMEAGTEEARKMAMRRDFLKTPQERLAEAVSIVSAPDAATRAAIRQAWAPDAKAARIADLREQLSKATGATVRAVEAKIREAEARKDKEQLLADFQAENERLTAEILKRMQLSREDVALSLEDRYAMQEAVMELDGVKQALEQYGKMEREAIKLAVRGYSDEAIAKRTGVPVAQVAKLAEDFRSLILKREIAKTLQGGLSFKGIMEAGKAILNRILSAPQVGKFGLMAAQGQISQAAKIGAEVDRILSFAMQPSRRRNRANALDAKVVTLPSGQKVRLFVPFDPDDNSQYFRYARELSTRKASAFDKIYEYWINGILSGPQTQVANISGNALQIGWHYTGQRVAEAALNTLYRDPESAQWGEFPHVARAFIKSVMPAVRQAALAFSTEADNTRSQYLNEPLTIDFKDANIDKVGGTRASVAGAKGRVIRVPGRLLRFADAFFKTGILHAEAATYAYREAKAAGMKGKAVDAYMTNRLSAMGSGPWLKAMETAEELLFQSENTATTAVDSLLGGSKSIGRLETELANAEAKSDHERAAKLRSRVRFLKFWGHLMRVLFPFQRTPTNIIRTGLRKAGGSALAAIYHTSSGLWGVKNGKPFLQSYAKAQQIKDLSETALAGLGWYLLAGMMEGDEDDDKKRILFVGNRPYGATSRGERETAFREYGGTNMLVIRDENGNDVERLPFQRYEPIATTLGSWIDATAAWRAAKRTAKAGGKEDEIGAVTAEFLASVGSNLYASIEGKSFLQGVSGIMEGFRSVEQKRAEPLKSLGKAFLQGAIPNIIRQPLRNLDPMLRESKTAAWQHLALPSGDFAEPKIDVTGRQTAKEGAGITRLFFQTATNTGPVPDPTLLRLNRKFPTEAFHPAAPIKTQFFVYAPGTKTKIELQTATEKRKFQEMYGRLYTQKARAVEATLKPWEKDPKTPAQAATAIERYKAALGDALAQTRKSFALTGAIEKARAKVGPPPMPK